MAAPPHASKPPPPKVLPPLEPSKSPKPAVHLPQSSSDPPLLSSNPAIFPPDPAVPLLRSPDPAIFPLDPAAPLLRPPDPSLRPPDPAGSSSDGRSPPEPAASASSPTGHHLPAAPEAPPAMPPESAGTPPPLSSSIPISPPLAGEPLPVQRANLQKRHPPVRRNAQVNPPLLKSYAQAAMGAPGPGFVRAHARDVESFARLPRTGINVICKTREGIPVFSLEQSDMHKVEGLYAKALVMKFHRGRPSLAASHKEISCWGLESPFSIGPLTSRSFLLRFQDERDLLKILTRPSSTLITFPYKIFRWHSRCHKNEDSVKVPVWISLPRLPLQCFAPEFLESIANRIGRFLCLDKATATLARPSTARMCIELDLRETRPQYVWIDFFEGHKQPIVYERVPKFCSGCHVQGHTNVDCSKVSLDTLQNTDSGPPSAFQERSQTDRQYAKNNSDVVPQVIPIQSRASSTAATAANLSASFPPQQDPSAPSHQQLLPPPISPVILSAEQQVSNDPLPHLSAPSHQAPLAAATYHPADQHPLQSIVDGALHQPIPPAPSSAIADSSSSIPATAVSPFASVPPPCHHPSSEVQSDGHQTSEPAHTAALPPSQSLSAQAAPFSPSDQAPPMQQTPKSSSVKTLFPAIKLMPSPRSSTVRAKAAVVSAPAPPLHQPPLNQNPSHPPASSRSKHHKSVSFMTQQSNLQANNAFWDVVNRQMDQFKKACLSSNEKDPVYPHPADLSSFSHFESDSGASDAANSPMGSHSAFPQEEGNSFPQSYASEGEELNVEPISLQGHISDNAFYQRPKSTKRNKRHPDGPLKVKLRARKGSTSIHR